MALHLRFVAVVLALCVTVFVCAPLQAQAAPITYDFTSGPLSGWFTYDSALAIDNFTNWDFSDLYGTYTPSGLVNTNDSTTLAFGDATSVNPGFSLIPSALLSLTSVSETAGTYSWSALYSDSQFPNEPISADGSGGFSARSSPTPVPGPNTFWSFAGGLLLFLSYERRQRRRAGMQVA